MKKVLAFILAMILLVSCFAGCGKNDTQTDGNKVQTDMEYVKEKGTLVVGITDFKPMDYQEGDSDEWIGFDFECNEWISPYGEGRFPDVLLRFSAKRKGIRNRKLHISNVWKYLFK